MSTEYGVGRLKLVVIIMRLLVRSLDRSGKYSLDSKLSPFRIKGVGDKRVYLSIAVPLGLLSGRPRLDCPIFRQSVFSISCLNLSLPNGIEKRDASRIECISSPDSVVEKNSR